MTLRQIIVAGMVFAALWLVGGRWILAESRPDNPVGRTLQIELDAYTDHFIEVVGITPTTMQWSTMVLPVLEMDSPAITYGWHIPPPSKQVEGGPQIWLALFTFHQDMMLMMEPMNRRVIAAHEVAHMTGRCMNFPEPDETGMAPMEIAIARYSHQVLVESCADIVSAELTSAKDVLNTLVFLYDTWYRDNIVLAQRIVVMQRVIERQEEVTHE